jgi:hypothetical protein
MDNDYDPDSEWTTFMKDDTGALKIMIISKDDFTVPK